MTAPDNLPKVIHDIQDAVIQLCEQFKVTNEPITDDNPDLHRLCAKLEFLFTSSLREQSILGVPRSYWNWIHACLKVNKGLSDGIRYVRGNKEVHSTAGKGRLFVRYSLVHHTLADSLQNCVMNKATTSQHINPRSILANPLYSSALVTALYDLHGINFDLNTKGYDLDSGWPTFASKTSQATDKWEIQSNAESTSSGSTTLPMDSVHAHSSVNTASHVDRRLEDLMFELAQADNKTKTQQDVISSHEAKTEAMIQPTHEEDDALFQKIADLESKNRLLHDTIDQLSSDSQALEQRWSEKYDILLEKFRSSEEKNETLSSKIEQLEQEKKTLADQSKSDGSVAAPATIYAFSSHSNSSAHEMDDKSDTPGNIYSLAPASSSHSYSSAHELDDKLDVPAIVHTLASASSSHSNSFAHKMCYKLDELTKKNLVLAEQLADSQAQCALFQSKMKEHLFKTDTLPDSEDKVEMQQAKIEELKTEVCAIKLQHETFLCRVKDALQLDGKETSELNEIIESTRCLCEIAEEALNKTAAKSSDHLTVRAVTFQEENNQTAIEPGPSKCRVKEMDDEVIQLKVQLEVMSTKAAVRIAELEDQISTTNQDKDSHERSYRELLADLQKTREDLKQTESELEAARDRCSKLYQKESGLKEELEATKRHYEDEICENEFLLEELQAEMKHQTSLNETLDQKLGQEKVKCCRLNGELLDADRIIKTFTRELEETKETLILTEDTVSKLQADMMRINETELVREKQMNFLSGQVEGFFEHVRLLEDSEDLEKVTLQGSEAGVSVVDDTDGLGKWNSFHSKFFDILLKYKETKSKLTSLEKEHTSLSEEVETYKKQTEELSEELSEVQSYNDIHLVTIKDLSDKHKVLQDAKASISDELDQLQFEKNNLVRSLEESRKVTDELQLRVMEESAIRLELEGKVELQTCDIESLKDKVTQLLLDKDTLWKEKEELRDRFNEHPEDPGEPDWMHDDDATQCTGCDAPFSITLRRHHCRLCGKIFCKNCCGNWKERKNKKIRICNACFETFSLDQSDLAADDTSRISLEPTETPSKEYEEIEGEESHAVEQHVDDDIFSDFDDRTPNVKSQDNISVPARREVHLPIHIEHPGIVLHWEISTDRDINFKLCYSQTEEDELQELVPLRRIDSHIKPFTGDIEAKKEGVYTLILDNTYSRFTAKQVLYTLRTFT